MVRVLALVLGLSLVLAAGADDRAGDTSAADARAAPEAATGIGRVALAFGRSEMVAAASPAAVDAARSMLAAGGSAVDAAIAAQLVLSLVEPQSSGIGGGGFLVYSGPQADPLRVYDGRETAPAAAGPNLFLAADGQLRGFFQSVDSGRSVGVPGLLRMLELAHREHGRLPWGELFGPAMVLAREGFVVSPRLHALLTGSLDRIRRSPSAARHYLDPSGQPWPVGHRLRDPEFAETLAAIVAGGADAFYEGPIATAVAAAVSTDPRGAGTLTRADMAAYRPVMREPVCGSFRGLRVCGAPPPSSGAITLLQALGIFERLEPEPLPDEAGLPLPALSAHRLVEAYRLAYADRAAWIADPDFFAVPDTGLLTPAYLDERAALVTDARPMAQVFPGQPPGVPEPIPEDDRSLPSTTHLVVVDRDGAAVSLTSSIEFAFGNLMRVRGFLLNNQLTDFSLAPADAQGRALANRVEPGKRPRSTMAPTLVFDARDNLLAALGSPGGTQIVQYVAKVLVALVDRHLPLDKALALPNFGSAGSRAPSIVEAGAAGDALARALAERGHLVRRRAQTSGVHALVRNAASEPGGAPFAIDPGRGQWAGAADPRREGGAAGDRRQEEK